jgi:stalled ribosome alternative rescue factor ArfA
MVKRRRNTTLPSYEHKISEIDVQIQKLQREREVWVSKCEETTLEIGNIFTEHEKYLKQIKDLSENKDYTKDFNGFHLKVIIKKNNPSYQYYEGSVRGRVEKGRKGKDSYFPLGSVNPRKVVRLVQNELGIQLDDKEKDDKRVLEDYLYRVLRKRWLEEISSVDG